MTEAFVDYISASTNRFPHAADCSLSSFVAFGSSKLVALWDPTDDRGIFQTLPGHDALVTCVRFIDDSCFLSADENGRLVCWRKSSQQWREVFTLPAHSKSILALESYKQWVITGASDATVKVWTSVKGSESDVFTLVQTLDMMGKYPLDIRLSYLPSVTALVLAVAGTDTNIQIWVRSDDKFVHSASLSGHEDWVRSLGFSSAVPPLMLASGSQDGTIRLWKFEPFTSDSLKDAGESIVALSDDLLDAFEASLGQPGGSGGEGGRQISMKRHILTVRSPKKTFQYSITFDALLIGHEAGITSLSWRPRSPCFLDSPTLLSTSTDSSIILWSPATADDSSLWINRQRFGDIGGQRLGGFVGGLWACGGADAMAWGWAGGWRRWRCSQIDLGGNNASADEVWSEVGAISGHRGPVKGIAWSPRGEYIISTGLDQTTRIHAPMYTARDKNDIVTWHEIGRPQVHGYDLVDVAFIDSLKFISIADEKVARVFEAPLSFLRLLKLCGVSELSDFDAGKRPLGASVPPLGLSNKALSSEPTTTDYSSANSTLPSRRPYEGELASITLWPEVEKVFGHGYELIALAVSHSSKLVATACKATTSEHAVIRVYDTINWQLVGSPLKGHLLTVTRISFSPNDRLILSVSRDRTWRLFECGGEDSGDDSAYIPVTVDKSHARIIWDCAWTHASDMFATAARDKAVKIWSRQTQSTKKWINNTTLKTREAATAVDFAPQEVPDSMKLAVGIESGDILIYSGNRGSERWDLLLTIDASIAHIDHIHHLKWRPNYKDLTSSQLASCSEDGTLRILNVHMGLH